MSKYSIVEGKFPCHTCKENVGTLRQYIDDKLLTWKCSQGHLSQVSLNTRKTKEQREREERSKANRS